MGREADRFRLFPQDATDADLAFPAKWNHRLHVRGKGFRHGRSFRTSGESKPWQTKAGTVYDGAAGKGDSR